jgi:hypothetical protein
MNRSFWPMTTGQAIPILAGAAPGQMKETLKNSLAVLTFLEALKALRVKLAVAE